MLINWLEPTDKAKYVEFTTLYDPKQMPEQQSSSFPWLYVEGLTNRRNDLSGHSAV